MFKLNGDHEATIANTDIEMKFYYTKHGINFIASDDYNQVSNVISFDDIHALLKWLSWLENDGMFNEDEEDPYG